MCLTAAMSEGHNDRNIARSYWMSGSTDAKEKGGDAFGKNIHNDVEARSD